MKNNLFVLSFLLFLTGCSSLSKNNPTVRLPKVPKLNIPGGIGDNWRYLGLSENNELIEEINDNSIFLNNNNTYDFEDRKTISSPNTYSYYTDSKMHYKYILSKWQLDCINKTYLLLKVTTYDNNANLMQEQNFNNSKWVKFGIDSFGQLQYNYICLKQNQNLGY